MRLRAAGCVFAEEEAALLVSAAADPQDLARLARRREAGEPLEHILGWVEFAGLRLAVAPGVFVPRRRTEFLAERAVRLLLGSPTGGVPPPAGARTVLDMCCGCGALGAALAAAIPGIGLHASDIDEAAVRCARSNLAAAGGTVWQGDLFAPLPASLRHRIDLIAVNAPYVPTDEIALMPPEARCHEPLVALDGGPDGLDLARRVVAEAGRWLVPGGHVLVETSARQAPALLAAARAAGCAATVEADEERAATVLVAGIAGNSDGGITS